MFLTVFSSFHSPARSHLRRFSRIMAECRRLASAYGMNAGYGELPMNRRDPLISWAPRVRREKILQLYIQVASGTNDEELMDDVAWSFYRRCSDIVRIWERRFACPLCREELPHPHPPGIPPATGRTRCYNAQGLGFLPGNVWLFGSPRR